MDKGDKIRFKEEKQSYTVRAVGDTYAVCTKPFNARKTVLYTIVDLQSGIRGTENLIFGFGAETDGQCDEMLKRLESGETEISHRNRIPSLFVTLASQLKTNNMNNYKTIREFILKYLEPKGKYNGVTAHELTMALMGELGLEDSIAVRGFNHGMGEREDFTTDPGEVFEGKTA